MTNRISRVLAVSLLFLAGFTVSTNTLAQEPSKTHTAADISAKDILQKVRQAYASISTYRDTGWTVHQYKTDAWTNTFTEVLGTRTRYRIEVITAAHPFSRTNRFWCDGMEHSSQAEADAAAVVHHTDQSNLSSVYDETCIPAVYFLINWGNVFTPFKMGPDTELLRKPDDTVGEESCYVVARTTPEYAGTLWIGKRDFLIRRYQSKFWTETHENIVINEQIQPADYLPLTAKLSP
jgi:outer membrane lipoprotein-sorting protein